MPSSIGLRIYELKIRRQRQPRFLTPDELNFRMSDLVRVFIDERRLHLTDTENERRWHLEPRQQNSNPNRHQGVIHYGIFGFESTIVSLDGDRRFDRQADDVDQIPLLYDFWFPGDHTHGFLALQSFKGRSCVSSFNGVLAETLRQHQPGFALNFDKLSPGTSGDTIYADRQVKRLRFRGSSDGRTSAGRFGSTGDGPLEIELSVKAQRRSSLGLLRDVAPAARERLGTIAVEDTPLDEAYADVKIGNKLRKVAVFGLSSDAGAIDVTDDVVLIGGHPTFASISAEAGDLMTNFHQDLYPNVR